jgi:hypothetical protein
MRFPAVAVALWLVPTLAMPQSLGDVARKQARKRSAGAPATKVYTDTDLRPAGGRTEGAPAETTAEPSARAGGADTALVQWPPSAPRPAATAEDALRAQLDREEGARRGRERYWRQSAGQALAQIESMQREYEASCGRSRLIVVSGG